jgi:tetratricopeptide (TPR) repeat protein
MEFRQMALVEREAELRILNRELVGAAAKRGGLVVLSGEPGIGKTSLLRELGVQAESAGFRVLHVLSSPQHVSDQDVLWQRIWRGLRTMASADGVVAASASPWRSAEHHVNGHVDGYIGDLGTAELPDGQSSAVLSASILRLLDAVSQNCPLLVAIDDTHYADERSLELLEFLSHSASCLPVLIVSACRSCALARGSQSHGVVEVLAACGKVVDIGPLAEDAAAQLLGRITNLKLDRHLVALVCQLTGGNPRFILECEPIVGDLYRMTRRGSSKVGIRVPTAIRLAIKDRIRPLSSEAKQVLDVGALFPNGFSSHLISEVADLDENETHSALMELQSAGLVRAMTDRTYDCAHGFTKELLYRELSVPRRSYLHRRIASALEAHDSPYGGANAAQIVHHLTCSGEPRLVDRAIRYAQAAGKELVSIREFSMAAELYSLVINSIDAEPSCDIGEKCRILLALGAVQREIGQIENAQRSFCRAAGLAQDRGDKESLVRIALGMPDAGWPLSESPNEVAIMLAEQSLNWVADNSSEKMLLIGRLAAELSYFKDRYSRSEALVNEAEQIERRLTLGNDRAILELGGLRDRLLRRPDLLELRLSNADQTIDLARRTGHNDALFIAFLAKTSSLLEIGDMASADLHFGLLRQTAALEKRPKYRVVLLSVGAAQAVREGKMQHSFDLCGEAREVAKRDSLESLADRLWPSVVFSMREQGRMAELLPIAERATEAQSHAYTPRALLCWLLFELDRVAQASAYLDCLAEGLETTLKQAPYPLATAALMGDVSAGLKILSYATTLYEYLLPFKDRYVIVGPTLTSFGSVSRYLGNLALALSMENEAIAHFEEALNLERKARDRPSAAYSQVALAKALVLRRAPGDLNRAGEILTVAAGEAAELEMHALAAHITSLGTTSEKDPNGASARIGSLQGATLDNKPDAAIDSSSPIITLSPCASLRQKEVGWVLTFEGYTARLKELRGLTFIAYLLSRPNEAINTIELTYLGKLDGVSVNGVVSSDLGPMLDENAKRAYRNRVRELKEELEEARASANEEVALELEEELCFITREIARGVGLFGRDRRTGSDAERARVRVTNSIKFAIAKIAECQPTIGSYLQKTIRTGASCSYIPERGAEIVWEL